MVRFRSCRCLPNPITTPTKKRSDPNLTGAQRRGQVLMVWRDRLPKTTSCSACAVAFGTGGGSVMRCPNVVVKRGSEIEGMRPRDIRLTDERVTWCECLCRLDG